MAKSFIVDVLQSSIYDSGYFPILSDNYNIFFMCFSFIFHWVAKRRKVSKEKKANFKFFRPHCNVSKHVFEDFTEAFVTFYVVFQTDFKRNWSSFSLLPWIWEQKGYYWKFIQIHLVSKYLLKSIIKILKRFLKVNKASLLLSLNRYSPTR